jgi:hypothetical protein
MVPPGPILKSNQAQWRLTQSPIEKLNGVILIVP